MHKLRKALDCNVYEILDKPFEEPNEENGIFLSGEDLNYMQAINDCLAEAPGELLYLPRNLGTEVMFIEIKV